MTDAEFKANIGNESNQSLMESLVYYGVDMYYQDLWVAVLREISKRLGDVDFPALGIGE